MDREDLKRGDHVRVRGFSGVACWYVGPETRPGETETVCWECDGRGDTRERTPGGFFRRVSDELCSSCGGDGLLYDPEPEPVETGRALVVMVGDDYKHVVDYEDLEPLAESAYCRECGQIGCTHDGFDRDDDDAPDPGDAGEKPCAKCGESIATPLLGDDEPERCARCARCADCDPDNHRLTDLGGES